MKAMKVACRLNCEIHLHPFRSVPAPHGVASCFPHVGAGSEPCMVLSGDESHEGDEGKPLLLLLKSFADPSVKRP